jgi:hypothetical protein
VTSILTSPSDHTEMPKRMVGRKVVRTCSCGKPFPCEEGRWNRLRAEVERYRDAHRDHAADLEGEGKDSGMPFARALELDWVLATMDRMEAGE